MKLLNNPKPVAIAVVVIILMFAAYGVFATEMEVGPTFTGEFNGGIGITVSERFLNDRVDVGVALIGDQEFNGQTTANNGNVYIAFVSKRPDDWVRLLPDEISIGGAHWIKTDSRLIGCQQGYLLGIKYLINEKFSIGVRHWSNAGICKPNRGQDLLTFGIRF